jgi:hypothetical protein
MWKDKNGNISVDDKAVIVGWRKHFLEPLNNSSETRTKEKILYQEAGPYITELASNEVFWAVRYLKHYKAPWER